MIINPTQFDELFKAGLLSDLPTFVSFYKTNDEKEYTTEVNNDLIVAPHMGVVPNEYEFFSSEQKREAEVYWRNISENSAWQRVRQGEMMFREARYLFPDYVFSVDPEYARVTLVIEEWTVAEDRVEHFFSLSDYDRVIISNYVGMCQDRIQWRLTRNEKDIKIEQLEIRLLQLEDENEKLKRIVANIHDTNRMGDVGMFRGNY